MSDGIESSSIVSIGCELRSGRISSHQLTSLMIDRIHRANSLLHCFIGDLDDRALAQARVLDMELARGMDRGPLHGVPISLKDLFDLSGARTTAGSGYLADSEMVHLDSRVATALQEAGAVIVGKNNMSEFAVGMHSTNRRFGDMPNPWDLRYTAGGSSGGTASSVAARLCFGGIGSDTGGSIRFPASVCGVVGIRPTSGTIGLGGAFGRSASLDTAGPIARSVEDAAILLDALMKRGRLDGVQACLAVGAGRAEKPLRVGVVTGFCGPAVHPAVKRLLDGAASFVSDAGMAVREIYIEELESLSDDRFLRDILRYEFYDFFTKELTDNIDGGFFSGMVLDELMAGSGVLRSDYMDALDAKNRLAAGFRRVFGEVDVLLTPIFAGLTPFLHAGRADFIHARDFLLPVSLTGCPAMSVPCGFDDAAMPVGIQLVADHYQERNLVRLGHLIEQGLWGPEKRAVELPFSTVGGS